MHRPWREGRVRQLATRPWEQYRRFVAGARGSSYKPWESLIGQIYLGGEPFCEMVQKIVSSEPRSRAHPRAQLEVVRPTLEHVVELVAAQFGETADRAGKHWRNWLPGNVA